MAIFLFEAKDKDGNTVKGKLKAATEAEANKSLHDKGFMVATVTPQKTWVDSLVGILGQVTAKDKVMAFKQLSTMINAGLPLLQSLRILVDQTPNKFFKKILKTVADDVESGLSLYAAVGKFPNVFSTTFVNMIKMGERAGNMDQVLEKVADDQERSAAIRSKIIGAMIYPAFVIVTLVLAAGLMMVMVVPQLKGVFSEANVALPLSTTILIGASNLVTQYWSALLLIGVVLLGAAYYYFFRTVPGKRAKDIIIIRIPLFGRIARYQYMSHFARTLSLLISGGIPILDSLEIAGEVIPNHLYQKAIKEVTKDVERGISISDAMTKHKVFPSLVIQMVNVGEQTGRVDSLLFSVAEYYESELDTMIKSMLSLLEPILLIIMGLGVAFFVFSILLPIYNISSFTS